MNRDNQRRRTRKDLLDAATRLLKAGKTPTLDEVAEEATISRATAYRYFPGIDALLLEASIDVTVPDAEQVFEEDAGSLHERLLTVDTTLNGVVTANETALRAMLVHTLQRAPADLPARQNRRSPLIEAAIDPLRDTLDPDSAELLAGAIALITGIEAQIVFRDVLQTDDEKAQRIRHWAIAALAKAARTRP